MEVSTQPPGDDYSGDGNGSEENSPPESATPVAPSFEAFIPPPPMPTEPGLFDLFYAFLFVLILSLVVGMIVGIVYLPAHGTHEPFRLPGWLIPFSAALNAVLSLWAAWYFGCRRHGKTFSEGLAVRRVSVGQVAMAVVYGVLLALMALLVMSGMSAARQETLSKAPITEAIRSGALLMFIISFGFAAN